jgi:lipopolysaccharide export system permease protein
LTLFDRYILREFTGPFLLAAFAVVILMLSDQLFMLADWLLVKRAPAAQVWRLLGYRLPGLLVQALPIAALVGAMLGFHRFSRDSELVIMTGSGVSLRRLVAPVLAVTFLLSFGAYLTNELAVPAANHEAENIIRKLVFSEVSPEIREGVFFRGQDDTVFYIRRLDRARMLMEDVMVFQMGENPYPELITARTARFGAGIWHLEQGISRELDREGFVINEARFSSLDLRVDEGVDRFFGNQKTTQEMSRQELKANIQLFGRSGVDIRPFLVDYHLKLAMPFANFFFTLFGIPLALWVLRRPRASRLLGVGGTVVLVLTYYVLTPLCRSLGVNGFLTPLTAAWLPSLSFAALGAFLFTRLEKI